MSRPRPLVVLVGRPNVGKSTLFNRITGTRRAIVTPVPGTTRDVIAQTVEWQNVMFDLLDTGGMFGATEDPLHQLVAEKGHAAVASADLLVMVLDGQQGVVPGDLDIVSTLRATGTPVLAVVNKIDAKKARSAAVEFYELGIDPLFEVSAEHGVGVSDLLDEVVQRVRRGSQPEGSQPSSRETAPKETAIAIIGRPNAGKSSLVNRLLREERMLVSDVPGTTRDAVDTLFKWHRRDFRIVDTAGIRRPGRVGKSGPLESLSVLVARRAIESGRHVIIEKPSVLRLQEVDELIALARDRNVLAKVVYHKLADPDHKKLRTHVVDGVLKHVNNGFCSLLEPKSISGQQFCCQVFPEGFIRIASSVEIPM